tara:strand:- start:62 stop:487 length:426 start_codon:yes stop_codon:yes gene_type:complete
MDIWYFYLIKNKGFTYAGVSPTPEKRLRQHNGEICGGAKYTLSKGPGWEHICIISGFKNKSDAMKFEWAVKHVPPRNAGGLINRIMKLYIVLKKKYWTLNSPLAESVPLTINWFMEIPLTDEIPDYITQNKFIIENKSIKE